MTLLLSPGLSALSLYCALSPSLYVFLYLYSALRSLLYEFAREFRIHFDFCVSRVSVESFFGAPTIFGVCLFICLPRVVVCCVV